MRSLPLSSFAFDAGRVAEAHLAAEFAGGRTMLRRQHVGYPLHVTRGFHLDAMRPDLLTLYIQSASGGLYAGDRLKLHVAVGANAALHLTTQAATVVHDGKDGASVQQVRISVGKGAFCAISSDPYVLFPGANLSVDTVAVVDDDAVLFLADGISIHDPRRSGRAFRQYVGRQCVVRPDGRLLLKDFGRVAGEALRNGPLGTMAATATALVIAPLEKWPSVEALTQAVDQCGCIAGVSEAPNQAGLVIRMLAPDGGILTRGIEAAFHVAARGTLGVELARRRK
ncbi:urease accessory protein UreD [Bradyrhizobium sp. USDA 4454]